MRRLALISLSPLHLEVDILIVVIIIIIIIILPLHFKVIVVDNLGDDIRVNYHPQQAEGGEDYQSYFQKLIPPQCAAMKG